MFSAELYVYVYLNNVIGPKEQENFIYSIVKYGETFSAAIRHLTGCHEDICKIF